MVRPFILIIFILLFVQIVASASAAENETPELPAVTEAILDVSRYFGSPILMNGITLSS